MQSPMGWQYGTVRLNKFCIGTEVPDQAQSQALTRKDLASAAQAADSFRAPPYAEDRC
jgi:hypothetical protein